MRKDADVAPTAYRDPRRHRRAEALALLADRRGLGHDPLLPALVLLNGLPRRERGAQDDAVLRHQLEDLRRPRVAVLDRLNTCERGAAHPLGRRRVDRHRPAAAPRNIDHQMELLQGEGRTRLAAGPPAIVCVDLDRVCAASRLVAHHARQRIDAVGLLRPRRCVVLRRPPGSVAPRRDDGACCHDHARAGDDLLLDGSLETDVGIRGPLRPEIPDCREARLECASQVHGGARDSERERFFQDLIVPGRLVVRMQEDVRVSLDEPGEERRARQIDSLGVGRGGEGLVGTGADDPLAANEDSPPLVCLRCVPSKTRSGLRR